jgi:UDP-3-O-acyl N-acetylglucosamine deacetylase
MSMNVKRIGYRYQRTLLRPTEVVGIGFLTGAPIRLRFAPAPPSTGVVFVRTDLQQPLSVAAHVNMVSGTQRRTTLGRPPVQVALVEHVLAALAGMRVDNCLVELNGPEPPGLDGSAQQFVDAIKRTGVRMQPARRAIYGVHEAVLVTQGGATLALHPSERDELRITYALDYGPRAPIVRQTHTETITPETFVNFISCCRTFLLESEAHELRRQGLGSRTSASDLLIFGARGVIGNRLRFADEPARHKILDLVGDLSLFGHDLRGHVVAYRSGHPLNVELVRKLGRVESNGRHYQLTRAA